jgi:hypothetical protein
MLIIIDEFSAEEQRPVGERKHLQALLEHAELHHYTVCSFPRVDLLRGENFNVWESVLGLLDYFERVYWFRDTGSLRAHLHRGDLDQVLDHLYAGALFARCNSTHDHLVVGDFSPLYRERLGDLRRRGITLQVEQEPMDMIRARRANDAREQRVYRRFLKVLHLMSQQSEMVAEDEQQKSVGAHVDGRVNAVDTRTSSSGRQFCSLQERVKTKSPR